MGINSIAPLVYPEGKYVIPQTCGPRGDPGVEKPSSFKVRKTLPRSIGPRLKLAKGPGRHVARQKDKNYRFRCAKFT